MTSRTAGRSGSWLPWRSQGRILALALRRLWRFPDYSLGVVVNLGLGIGATTALFTVLYGVLLRPLPYLEPERLVVIEHEMPGIPIQGQPTVFGGFQGQALHYAERARQIESIGVFGTYDASIFENGEADYIRAGYASRGFFEALGLRAETGRLFRGGDSADDGPGAVLLTQATWQRRYGGDPGAVGRPSKIDGVDSRVVGVLSSQGPFPSEPVSLWTLRTDQQLRDTPQVLVTGLLARLRPGATVEGLRRELDGIISSLPEAIPDAFVGRMVHEGRLRSRVTPMAEHLVGGVASPLRLLLAAAGLVLVAALINVTVLRLLRNEAQMREAAIRRVLGARRRDLLSQHLAEAAVLAALSWVAGLALAAGGISWLLQAGPRDLPRAAEISLSPQSAAVAAALAVIGGLCLAVVQATARTDSSQALRLSGVSDSSSRRRARWRSTIAATELAAATVLLVGAGLLLRSFDALKRVDPGFETESVLTFRVPFPFQEVRDAGGSGPATLFFDQLTDRLAGDARIESVGYARCTPMSELCGLEGLTFEPEHRRSANGEESELFNVLQAGPGYLETLDVPLRAGRFLERSDHLQRTNAAVLSERAAKRLWGDEDPIGQRLMTPEFPDWQPFQVVGVVGDTHHGDLKSTPEAVVYLPVLMADQVWELWTTTFVTRSSLPPLDLVPEIRAMARELRPDIPVAHVETLAGAVERSTSRLRFAVVLLAAAAIATLALGATGVYGVIAYATSLRRGEFGIRLALGADGANLQRLVLAQGLTIAGLGLAAGLAAATLGSRFLESVLYAVGTTDPVTYGAVALLLTVATLLAGYLPAYRAAGIQPAEVLRGD